MMWAYIAFRMFKGVQLWSVPAHAFVRYDKLFYDAERLKGVEDWKDLPASNLGIGCGCFYCRSEVAKRRNLNDFKRRWNDNPIKPNWKWYQELADSFVEKRINHESTD